MGTQNSSLGLIAVCRAGLCTPGRASQQAAGVEEKGPEPHSSPQSVPKGCIPRQRSPPALPRG